jgi:hypothetical protein
VRFTNLGGGVEPNCADEKADRHVGELLVTLLWVLAGG